MTEPLWSTGPTNQLESEPGDCERRETMKIRNHHKEF